jgi:hypothetical protein
MRKGIATLASVAAIGALGVTLTGSAAADPPAPCPDDFIYPIPATAVPNGAAKDHNQNGIVCA